eukprot:COSAG03_NODE_12343_length_551_cov_1.154867_1_plen_36_part_01
MALNWVQSRYFIVPDNGGCAALLSLMLEAAHHVSTA